MTQYLLQIIHNTDRPEHGKGHNVIETWYPQRYQAEAEARRHSKRQHQPVDCEIVIMEAGSGYSLTDD